MSEIELNFTISNWETCGAGLTFLFFKEPVQEAGNILKDCLSECRKRLSEVFDKRRQIREARRITAERERKVPSKFMLSWSQYAMLEDNVELQKLWAILLVNAEDLDFKEEMRISYIEIMKNLTHLDARVLKEISNGCIQSEEELSVIIGADKYDVAISIDNLKRLRLVDSLHSAVQIQHEGKSGKKEQGIEEAKYHLVYH